MIGFLLGTVARGPALSVGLGLVWALVVENLLRGVGGCSGRSRRSPSSCRARRRFAGRLDRRHRRPRPTPGVLDTLSGGQATALLLGYLVLTPLVAGWLVTRRDVA